MPYRNLPPHLWDKMERCVAEVKKKNPNVNPYAVCYSSIMKKVEKASPKRSHLVPLKIMDKKGVTRTYWVNPGKKEGKEKERVKKMQVVSHKTKMTDEKGTQLRVVSNPDKYFRPLGINEKRGYSVLVGFKPNGIKKVGDALFVPPESVNLIFKYRGPISQDVLSRIKTLYPKYKNLFEPYHGIPWNITREKDLIFKFFPQGTEERIKEKGFFIRFNSGKGLGRAFVKAVIRTPLKNGKVDWNAVPVGASIWVTLKEGPLAGRPILITKRPDNKAAVVQGPLRHLPVMPKEAKLRAMEEDVKKKEEYRKKKEEMKPVLEKLKSIRRERKEEAKQVFKEFMQSVGISQERVSKAELEAAKERAVEVLGRKGIEDEKTAAFKRAVADGYRQLNDRITKRLMIQRRNSFERMLKKIREGKFKLGTEEEEGKAPPTFAEAVGKIQAELPEEDKAALGFKGNIPVAVPKIDIDKFETPQEVEFEVKKHFEKIEKQIVEHLIGKPEKKAEIETEQQTATDTVTAVTPEGTEEVNKTETLTIGKGIEPVPIETAVKEEKLQAALERFDQYLSLKAQERELAAKIVKLPRIGLVTPTALEEFMSSMEAVPPDKVDELREQYENILSENTISAFYQAIGEHWNDKLGNTLAPHIVEGAASAVSGILGDFLEGQRFEVGRIIEGLGVEAGCYALAVYLRRNLGDFYDQLLENLKEKNEALLKVAEKKALKEHERLQKQFDEIQRQKKEGSLNDDAITKALQAEVLLLQRRNLGVALGSMSATSALLAALEEAKKPNRDDRVVVSVGGELVDAYERIKELRLKTGKSAFVIRKPDGTVSILTSASKLQRFITREIRKSKRNGRWDRIKNDGSDTEGFKVPYFKDTFFNPFTNREEKFKFRKEQRNDIRWLEEAGGGVVARITGSGKTLTAYGFLANRLKEDPSHLGVVVVPNGRVKQWVEEARRFTTLPVVEIPEGMNKEERQKLYLKYAEGGVILVTSHRDASVDERMGVISAITPGTLVVDEPQELVTKSARLSAGARRIFKIPAKHRIALTATIARMKPVEAYNLVNWTNPGELGFRTRFQRAFSGYGSGINAQDFALENMLWKEIEPFVSAGVQTKRGFKVIQKEIEVQRTPAQIQRQKEITKEAEAYIKRRMKEEIEKKIAQGKEATTRSPSWRKKLKEKIIKEVERMHWNNLHDGDPQTNAKFQAMLKTIKDQMAKGMKKHVIFVDSNEQRRTIYQGLMQAGFKANQVKNITGTAGAKEVEKRKEAWKTDPNIHFLIIDKTSAAGHNLQEGNTLHVLGAPRDAAEYLQAQGRLAREPRIGDVNILTYLHEDNPFESTHWDYLRAQLKLVRATAPFLIQKAKAVLEGILRKAALNYWRGKIGWRKSLKV